MRSRRCERHGDERRERQGIARIQAQEAERSGTLVIEAKNVSFGYGERPVVQNLSTTILRGDKVGIIGANASGKTTLIRLLLGELPPQAGTIRHGTRLEIAYFDQLKATLDENKTVQQNISDYDTIPINGQPRHIISYLEDFLFAPERSRSLVKLLSGGERSRLLLARLFTKPSNVLVLDEPTNDLDIETLELLESLLVAYEGTVLLVSHDRAFLNEVVTSTLAIEPDGRIGEFDGGYDDYLRQRPEPAAVESKSFDDDDRSPPRATPEKRKKLSFKEKREMEALPGQIENLESELRELHATMADPSFLQTRPRGDRTSEISSGRARTSPCGCLRALGGFGRGLRVTEHCFERGMQTQRVEDPVGLDLFGQLGVCIDDLAQESDRAGGGTSSQAVSFGLRELVIALDLGAEAS